MINTELACRGNIISLSENAGWIIRMKWRSLFVCKWEIDYIYLERGNEQLTHTRTPTHTHTHAQMRVWSSHSCIFVRGGGKGIIEKTEGEREISLVAASSSMAHLSRIF